MIAGQAKQECTRYYINVEHLNVNNISNKTTKTEKKGKAPCAEVNTQNVKHTRCYFLLTC